jgi:hypothetical protein
MKKLIFTLAATLSGGLVQADNLDGVSRMLCAAAQVQICIENDICYTSSSYELDIPDFVIIDTDKKTISTTRASQLNRSTAFTSYLKDDGTMYLQGVEGGRAFSFVIDIETGRLTAAVARDGIAVNVFGVCTDAKP